MGTRGRTVRWSQGQGAVPGYNKFYLILPDHDLISVRVGMIMKYGQDIVSRLHLGEPGILRNTQRLIFFRIPGPCLFSSHKTSHGNMKEFALPQHLTDIANSPIPVLTSAGRRYGGGFTRRIERSTILCTSLSILVGTMAGGESPGGGCAYNWRGCMPDAGWKKRSMSPDFAAQCIQNLLIPTGSGKVF